MPLNISICDDEKAQRDFLELLVKNWAKARKTAAAISLFQSAEEFLFHYEDCKNPDILLLDIQMKEISGVDLAKKLRRENDHVQIIFITGIPDFIAEGYEVSALHYLIKPVKESKLFDVLDKAAARKSASPRTILLSKKSGSIKVREQDIIYAEVLSHKITLHLKTGAEEVYMRISDLENMLGSGFFRCHRSYIVSMAYVERVTKTVLILEGGREIPLSRNLYLEANRRFIEYN